ncbi:MAG TPA: SUMF1/EgtB/PvdO family nonheme iron enzyme, partial [Polyangiaceae bacterium]|nr:SUMF1/EgtB/PvdO family nonheme iron enzyme [Polyangiaceae bacterium]
MAAAPAPIPKPPPVSASESALGCRANGTPIVARFDEHVCPTWPREPSAVTESLLGDYDVVSFNGQAAVGHLRLTAERGWLHVAPQAQAGADSAMGIFGLEVFAPFFHPRARSVCERSGGLFGDFVLEFEPPRSDGSLRVSLRGLSATGTSSLDLKRTAAGSTEPPPPTVPDAIERGTTDDLSRLLAKETSVERSWLIAAIKRSQPRMVELLLKKGAAVNPVGAPPRPASLAELRPYDDQWGPALSYAVSTGDIKLVERLLQAGAELVPRVPTGLVNAPLVVATIPMEPSATPEIVDLLLDHGAPMADPGLMQFVVARPESLRLFLCHGLDANSRVYDGGSLLLHEAIHGGHLEAVRLLLAAKADPMAEESGDTPLDVALSERALEPAMVRLLLDAGATSHQEPRDLLGEVAPHTDLLREFLRRGLLDANASIDGGTLLHLLAGRGMLEPLAVALDAGAKLDVRDAHGKLPLELAEDEQAQQLLRRFPEAQAAKGSAAQLAAAIEGAFVLPPAAVVDSDSMLRITRSKKPLWLDRTEVTVAAYQACVKAKRCSAPEPRRDEPELLEAANYEKSERQNHPVNDVTVKQAIEYCAFRGKRLPSADEWEQAAVGAEPPRGWPWGNSVPTCKRAVIEEGKPGCGHGGTWPVGSRPLGASPD